MYRLIARSRANELVKWLHWPYIIQKSYMSNKPYDKKNTVGLGKNGHYFVNCDWMGRSLSFKKRPHCLDDVYNLRKLRLWPKSTPIILQEPIT